MNKEILKEIEQACEKVIKSSHGEVIIKIKNGVVYRILTTEDKYMV